MNLLPIAAPVAAAGLSAWGAFHPRAQLFGPTITRIPNGCALTFDDGPNPAMTPALLDLLDKHGARATFFLLGKYVRQYPELAAEIAGRGHAIGNHSDTHPSMLVTVSQRTREIGLRKAIGARSREILYQFLLEALIISGTGAIIGILIAVSIPVLVRPLLPPGMTIPISGLSLLVAFAVSCLTGVVFGYLPANRAAKLPPTEALRYE